MMMLRKQATIRIVEIVVHRSKKHPRLGHAVAVLFPCSHRKYLGLTLYKGDKDTEQYRTQDCRIIKLESYDVMDKEVCKLCPQDEFWLDELTSDIAVDDFVDVLEAVDDF